MTAPTTGAATGAKKGKRLGPGSEHPDGLNSSAGMPAREVAVGVMVASSRLTVKSVQEMASPMVAPEAGLA
jgi:hypothetical protein